MKVSFDNSFFKSLDKIKDSRLADKISKIIEEVEYAKTLSEVKNLKKLAGYKKYYRIRIGDFRIGLELINSNEFLFVIIANRMDIYKKFPN